MGVANSAGLALAGIDENTPTPSGGVYVKDPATGLLNGLLEENAAMDIQIMAMDFSVLQFFQMVKSAAAEYARVGVTTAQSGAVETQMVQGLSLASQLGMVPMRLELWPVFDSMGPKLLDGSLDAASWESDMVNIGAIKIMADGSIQGYTGYLKEPYHSPFHGDDQYRGYPRLSKEALGEWIEKYHRAGYQIAIHGNGAASIDDILNAIAAAQRKYPREDARHTIIHAQMAREDQLDTMQELGVIPSFFVAHTFYWGDRHRDIFMGPDRAARMSPAASALARGMLFTIHLDTPVVPMDPLFLMWTAVNRLSSSGRVIGPEQRIDAYTALRAVTIDAAWQLFEEENRGSIEVGKYADLVVLSGNPLENPTTIKDLTVELTMVGGRTIFNIER
jgi:predicted amidohydrolase YtcJ